MPAINEIIDVDFGSRVVALRAVGAALGLSNAQIPAQTMANSQRNYLYWINIARVAKSLPPLPDLDYSGFLPALNELLAEVDELLPPVVTQNPFVDASGGTAAGDVLHSTMGIWENEPTSYAYQWLRGGATIAAATTNSHTIVVADAGAILTCRVTATNAAGAGTPAVSNGVQC
jgi:hypothetical protein